MIHALDRSMQKIEIRGSKFIISLLLLLLFFINSNWIVLTEVSSYSLFFFLLEDMKRDVSRINYDYKQIFYTSLAKIRVYTYIINMLVFSNCVNDIT